jgi:hypothetical protein
MFNPPITGDKELDAYLFDLSLNIDGLSGGTESNPNLPNGDPGAYVYQYIHVKYADDNIGTGFSNTPTLKLFFGIFNSSSSVESTNPADYTWYKSIFPFGTINFLYYLILGGRKIKFAVNTSPPDYHWKQDDGNAIDLDIIVPPSTISFNEIMNNAITELKIARDAVTATKINVAALDQAFGDLRPNTVSAAQIATNAVTNLKLLDGAVTAAKTNVAALSPLTGFLNPDTVNTAQIVNNAVSNLKVLDGAITANKTNLAALDNTLGNLKADTVSAANLVANAVTEVKIAAGAVSAAKTNIAALSPLSGLLNANTVDTAQLVTGAVNDLKIAAGAITESKVGTGAITETKIGSNSVTSDKIIANAIVADKIAANSVVADKIAANAVVAGKIAANAVTASTIEAGAVVAGKIAADAVTATNIAANSIVSSKIAADAITSDKISANAVVAGKIAADAVTTNTIAAGAIVANKLAANSVTANAIAANSVVASKIAAGAVVAEAIAAGTITGDKIFANTITGANIAAFTIGAQAIAAQAITSVKIEAGAIIADKIAAGAVTTDKLTVLNLAAITANMGTLTSGEIIVGSAPTISGTTMTGSGTHLYSNGNFVLGNATTNVTFNGSVLSLNGQVVYPGNIDTRNLTIKDAAGNIILGAGTSLNFSNIIANSGWLNSNISISSNGTLNGAGGGTVSAAGLGAVKTDLTNAPAGILNSNISLGTLGAGAFAYLSAITSANVTTYISGAAIGTAQIGVLTANNIGAGTIDASKIAAGTIWTNNLQVGSSPAISGTNMTGAGARINSDGTFALGNSSTNITYNGSAMYLNGNVVATGNINANAVTNFLTLSTATPQSLIIPDGDPTNVSAANIVYLTATYTASGTGFVTINWDATSIFGIPFATGQGRIIPVVFSVWRNSTNLGSKPFIVDTPPAGVNTYTIRAVLGTPPYTDPLNNYPSWARTDISPPNEMWDYSIGYYPYTNMAGYTESKRPKALTAQITIVEYKK